MAPRHPCIEFPNPVRGTCVTSSIKELLISSYPSHYPYEVEDPKGGRLRSAIPWFEFRGVGLPPDDIGGQACAIQHSSVGDVYIDLTPGTFSLWVRLDPGAEHDPTATWTPGRRWMKWKGPAPDDPSANNNPGEANVLFDKKQLLIPHPYVSDRFLWCDGKLVAWLATNTLEINRRVMRKAGLFTLEGPGKIQPEEPHEDTKSESNPPSALDTLANTAAAASSSQMAPPPTYSEFVAIVIHRVITILLAAERGETTVIAQSIPKRRKTEKRDRSGRDRTGEVRKRTTNKPAPGDEVARRSTRRPSTNGMYDGDGMDDEDDESTGDEEEDEFLNAAAYSESKKRPADAPADRNSELKRQRRASPVASSSRAGNGYPRPQSPARPTHDTAALVLTFHSTITSRDTSITERDVTITERNATIKSQSHLIADQQRTIKENTAKLSALEATVSELNGRIGRRNAELDEHISTIQELTKAERSLTAENKKLQATVQHTLKLVDEAKATSKEQAASIVELSERVARRNAEIDAHADTIRGRDARIIELMSLAQTAGGAVKQQ